MTDRAADFRAEVDASRSDRDGFVSTRVLANESQVVLVADSTERTFALTDVFDIAQGMGTAASTSEQQLLTIAFRDGEIRETIRIRGGGDTIATFQIVLFKLLLDGTTVRVSATESGGNTGTASLELTRNAVRLQASDERAIAHEHVVKFETNRRSTPEGDPEPVVRMYWANERHDTKTTVTFPSFRRLNLFGRYLQSYVTPARAMTTPGSVRVLLVDDDPTDLEMAELMLIEEEPELSIVTATDADAGLDRLADDEEIHCLVSDYDMPGTDGIEFLRRIRKRYPDLPFILFTGQGSESVAKRALLSDVTDYVEKGIGKGQYEILAARIRSAVR